MVSRPLLGKGVAVEMAGASMKVVIRPMEPVATASGEGVPPAGGEAVWLSGERVVSLTAEVKRIVREIGGSRMQGRFEADLRELILGKNADSALPIAAFMCVDENVIGRAMLADDDGLAAIESEFTAHGAPEVLEAFHYIRYGATGDSTRQWSNGVLDHGRPTGQRLEWFCRQPEAQGAKLTPGMVLAVRLYTTACYSCINNPLRGLDLQFKPRKLSPAQPHPFPVTVHLLTEAIKRLRAVEANSSTQGDHVTLWRGMRNMTFGDGFLKSGGSEMAPMSTTRDLAVAVKYSASDCSVLLKLETGSFRERGADLMWISAFPVESECLFPPLTHLAPTGRCQEVHAEGITFTVVQVKPSFG